MDLLGLSPSKSLPFRCRATRNLGGRYAHNVVLVCVLLMCAIRLISFVLACKVLLHADSRPKLLGSPLLRQEAASHIIVLCVPYQRRRREARSGMDWRLVFGELLCGYVFNSFHFSTYRLVPCNGRISVQFQLGWLAAIR